MRSIFSFAPRFFVAASLAVSTWSVYADGPQQVSGADSARPSGAPPWVNLVMIGGLVLFMWLFVFRPQSKRAKEQKEFLSSLAPGLEVITSGGLIGSIVEVNDNVVSLNVGNGQVRVLKSSISGKYAPAATVEEKKA